MRRWIGWTAALLAGALCFHRGLRMLWFGHGNEPRMGALRVHERSLSYAAETCWSGVLPHSIYSSAL